MSKEFTKPLTPALRQDINISIDSQIRELQTCESNVFVNVQLIAFQLFALKLQKNLINALPDGYPLPMSKD